MNDSLVKIRHIKLEDKKGKEIMFAQGSFAGWNFKISHNEEQIAEISKLDIVVSLIISSLANISLADSKSLTIDIFLLKL